MMMFLGEHEKIIKGEFAFDCSHISLSRDVGPTHRLLQGPGRIEQNEHGCWTIRIHCTSGLESFEDKHYSSQSGEIYKTEELFRLTAIDYSDRKWEADGVILVSVPTTLKKSFIATAHVHELKIERISKDSFYIRDSVVMYVPRIPYLRLQHDTCGLRDFRGDAETGYWTTKPKTVNVKGFTITFKDAADSLQVKVTAKPLWIHDYTYLRLQDALSFASGQQTELFTRTEYRKNSEVNYFYSPIRTGIKHTGIRPPADLRGGKTCQSFWNIFKAFFAMVGPHEGGMWHPLSATNRFVLDSGAALMTSQSQSLIRAVAIEALINWLASKEKPSAVVPKEVVDVFKDSIRNCKVDEVHIKRAQSILSSLGHPNPKDFLLDLKERGVISDFMFARWKQVRPISAHGSVLNKDSRPDASVVQDADVLLALYYRLVLYAIQYSGPITDYSQFGWPSVDLPGGVADETACEAWRKTAAPSQLEEILKKKSGAGDETRTRDI